MNPLNELLLLILKVNDLQIIEKFTSFALFINLMTIMSSESANLKKRTVIANLSREEEEALIENLLSQSRTNNVDDDDDEEDLDELPFGGKVYLPRRHKPDSYACVALQVALVVGVLALIYYAYYYYEHMHVHVVKAYAHLGFDTAQHELGNRYLHGGYTANELKWTKIHRGLFPGAGVEQDERKAMEWYKKAADQGHPHSSYNLAIGHLKGIRTAINES